MRASRRLRCTSGNGRKSLPSIDSTSNARKYGHSRRNSRSRKRLQPCASRQTISPSSTALCARTACAISSARYGQLLNTWPFRETSWQWWPFTRARRGSRRTSPHTRSLAGRRVRGCATDASAAERRDLRGARLEHSVRMAVDTGCQWFRTAYGCNQNPTRIATIRSPNSVVGGMEPIFHSPRERCVMRSPRLAVARCIADPSAQGQRFPTVTWCAAAALTLWAPATCAGNSWRPAKSRENARRRANGRAPVPATPAVQPATQTTSDCDINPGQGARARQPPCAWRGTRRTKPFHG